MSGTLKVTTLQDGASATANMVFDTSGNTTAGGTVAMASSFKRNRIINGNMLIDQRNAGASLTPTAASTYTVDRWAFICSAASKFSVQQNAASVTPPAGFTNYLGATSLSAYSVAAGDYFALSQYIEGYNIADLGWGAAGASTITISFWVRSSLTGTFGGSLNNSAATRSYAFTYTISSANTWEQKSVTISGDTSGTWLKTNGNGLAVNFALGVGATYSGTAGSWAGSNYVTATGAVSVVGTSSATFYITGVQIEVGTKATPYEMQIYSDQLTQCQRYYTTQGPGALNYAFLAGSGDVYRHYYAIWPVTMRTTPTVSNITFGGGSGAGYQFANPSSADIYINAGNSTTAVALNTYSASAEL